MKGVLIVNLGTPDSPSTKDVKRYLGEFLMDKYVINLNYLSRLVLVKGIILNTRPKHSAEAYQKVWTDEGSPLLFNSVKLANKVKSKVDFPVELAMRYGTPNIKSGLQKLIDQKCDEILVFPLYPQYAMSSTMTVEEKVKEELKKIDPTIKLSFIKSFYKNEGFIKGLAEKIKEDKEKSGANYVLFSYHSLPVDHLALTGCDGECCSDKQSENGLANLIEFSDNDCYKYHCLETTKAVVEYLGLKPNEFEIAYQSKLGRKEWLTPRTVNRLTDLAKEGKTKVLVTTPSFTSDCLETIEEIGMEGKHIFLENGGEIFHRTECLNDDDGFVETVIDLITK